jgi:outer membrane protein assembly factor BamA
MKCALQIWLLPLVFLACPSLWAREDARDEAMDPAPAAFVNINERYAVESIDFSGIRSPKLSASVLTSFRRMIGDRLDQEELSRLCAQIGGELRAEHVSFRIARGSDPGRVKVVFEVVEPRVRFDAALPQFGYASREGLSGSGEAHLTLGRSVFSIAAVTNASQSVANFTGVRASYQLQNVGSDRVQVTFRFDDYRNRYNNATEAAASAQALGSELYRGRIDFEPELTVLLAEPLKLTLGYDIEDLRIQGSQGKSVFANAATGSLRYRRQWGSETAKRLLEVGYGLRAATRTFGSGYSYFRHELTARYVWKRDRQSVETSLLAGSISGNAPFLDKFVLGTSNTLRGWDKYDIDPLGGSRVSHASVTYGFGMLRAFYDAGSIWSRGEAPQFRESAGAGFQKDRFLLACAFPLRAGHAVPMLIAGMNF